MTNKLISQGAEAKIFLTNEVILKSRISKAYRHQSLDNQLRTRRTKSESKILSKALESGVSVPKVLNTEKFDIQIEYINGDRLSETLNNYDEKKQFQIMKEIGHQVATLHKNDIIHGDLTTSNTILKDVAHLKEQISQNKRTKFANKGRDFCEAKGLGGEICDTKNLEVFLIDFGLSFISSKIEDKAVDLHLIKQALEAKHYQNHEKLFKEFCKGYIWDDSKKVLERLSVVEKRGRYKH